MDRIESFLDGFPGYSGYRDKERRRDSDKRLRESIANQLESLAQRVERGGAALVSQGKLDSVVAVEHLVRTLNHAANLVRTQSYGYGGIFSDTPVDERALNQLYLFDKGLSIKVDQLDGQLAGIESTIGGAADLATTLQEAEGAVRSITEQLAVRSTVVETAAPATSRSVFAPVDKAAKSPPPPIAIEVGDAIAWFDEDYLVDAIIEVADSVERVRFFHLQKDPETWLCIADRDPVLIALLHEDLESGGLGDVAWTLIGSGTTRSAEGGKMKAEAVVTCYLGEDETVAFRLLSGTDERYFTGKRVHPDDLAVYGKPAKS